MNTKNKSRKVGYPLDRNPVSLKKKSLDIYILVCLNGERIETLESVYSNLAQAKWALQERTKKILDATDFKVCITGYGSDQTIEEENQGLKNWDDMLSKGQITEETYNLSWSYVEDLCIVHYNDITSDFECTCGRSGCKFTNAKPIYFPSA